MSSDASNPGPIFPKADVQQQVTTAGLLRSKLWWVTAGCVLTALLLTWQSLPETGPTITIRFPEGHGLKAGDALRHRGIDVGIVESVSLTPELDGIQARVVLQPKSETLCRDDSRFWIVRPRLSLSGIEGLETIVGARYIAVSPGTSEETNQRQFTGLATAPPDELAGDGLELLLQADTRSGLNPGAPVTWRGVQVGQVLSVALSADARHVNASVRIQGSYRRLVKTGSKFWVTSGLGVHVGLSGIDLHADSLASLALGGVSFITPQGEGNTLTTVTDGHVFRLEPNVDQDWLDHPAAIPLTEMRLPQTVTIVGTTHTKFLGIPRQQKFRTNGMLLSTARGIALVTANLPMEETESAQQIPELQIQRDNAAPIVIPAGETTKSATPVKTIYPDANELKPAEYARWHDVVRVPIAPEDCFAVRTVPDQYQIRTIIHSIPAQELTATAHEWTFSNSEQANLLAWNGCPVVAAADGRVIGLLIAAEKGTTIAPMHEP